MHSHAPEFRQELPSPVSLYLAPTGSLRPRGEIDPEKPTVSQLDDLEELVYHLYLKQSSSKEVYR